MAAQAAIFVVQTVLLTVALVALFLGWNAPNHYPPWASFHLELFAAAGLGLVGGALVARDRTQLASMSSPGARGLPLPRLAWAWFVVSLLPVLQLASGTLVFRADAVLGWLYCVGVAIGLYFGSLWAARTGRGAALRWLWCMVVASGLAACGLALAQWLRLGPAGWWAMELIDQRPFANLGQPNHFGLLMVLALVALTALYESRDIVHRWVFAAAAAMCGLGVLVSQSRASILAIAVLLGLWLFTRRSVPSRLRLGEVMVALTLAAVAYALFAGAQAQLLGHVETERGLSELGAREAIWRHFAAAIAARPWSGWGFNQGVLALSSVADQVQPSRNTVYAHNLVLDLMTWFGVPVALALCCGLGLMLWRLLGSAQDALLRSQRCLVLAAWLALLAQSMLEFPYAYAYFLLPLALLTGVVLDSPADSATASTRWRIGWGGGLLAAIAILVLGTLTVEYLRVEDDFRHARFERANFIGQPPQTYLDKPLILDHLATLNASARFAIRPGMQADELKQLGQLARRFNIPSTRVDYARALALNGRLVEAEAEVRVMRALNAPDRFRQIEAQWGHWLRQHGLADGQSPP